MTVSSWLFSHLRASLFLLVLLCFATGSFCWGVRSHYQSLFKEVCLFVSDRIFLTSEEQGGWLEGCLLKAASTSIWNRTGLMEQVNQQFDWLGVSHLRMVGPHEAEMTWHPEKQAQDKSPQFSVVNSEWAYLQLQSFLPQYFEASAWTLFAEQMARPQNLVIDLRENQGGNFVAMLRVLSSLYCQPGVLIGSLLRPKSQMARSTTLGDLLEDEEQLDLLDQFREARLETFDHYPCVKSKLFVVTHRETASVSEIMTLALKQVGALQVGERTAGTVLVGVWHPLKILGPNYWLTLPEALFVGPQGEVVEGKGVHPDVDLPVNNLTKQELIELMKALP